MSGIRQPLEEMCPYVYETAVSPHLASRLEGNPVRMETVLEKFHEVCEKYEYVTVEGSGGILCPLCFDEADLRLPDVVKACDFGCLIVADAGLGTINGVALTAYYLKEQGIALKGIILNHYRQETCSVRTTGKCVNFIQEFRSSPVWRMVTRNFPSGRRN